MSAHATAAQPKLARKAVAAVVLGNAGVSGKSQDTARLSFADETATSSRGEAEAIQGHVALYDKGWIASASHRNNRVVCHRASAG